MEIVILIPILFLTYLVLLIFNSCTHQKGHKWDVEEVMNSKGKYVLQYKCENCGKEKLRRL